MSLSRHFCREIVFQVLFSWEFTTEPSDETAIDRKLQEYMAEFHKEDITLSSFLRELFLGILHHIKVIQQVITTYAPEWPLDKINPVDRNILYLGIYEILYDKDVPDVVAIDESIELGKKFGNENSSKFINGVLNTVMKNKESILTTYAE